MICHGLTVLGSLSMFAEMWNEVNLSSDERRLHNSTSPHLYGSTEEVQNQRLHTVHCPENKSLEPEETLALHTHTPSPRLRHRQPTKGTMSRPVVSSSLATCCTVLSVFGFIILGALGLAFNANVPSFPPSLSPLCSRN
jgi:hypothetical protein